MDELKTWNVLTGVVQLVEAATAAEARQIAEDRVSAAVDGFGEVYDIDLGEFDHGYELVFLSEPQ